MLREYGEGAPFVLVSGMNAARQCWHRVLREL
jgi:hypothetical protein